MRVSAVYACVRVLADSVAMLPLRLYEDGGLTSRIAVGHPLDRLMNKRPNFLQTPFEFKRFLVGTLALRGNAYVQKFMVGSRNQQLIPLHPDRVTPKFDETTMQVVYEYRNKDGVVTPLRQSDIMHFRALSTDRFIGLSPVAAAAEAIGLAMQTEKHGAKLFTNAAQAAGVLKHPQLLSGDAAKRLKETFDAAYSGADNAHKTMLLEEGMTWEKVGMTSEEAQFLETRKFQRNEIAMFFGIPPHMIGDIDRGTSWGSGIEQQGIGFVTYTLLPWLTNISQACDRDLLSEQAQDQYSYKFETDELTRADFLTRQQGREIQARNGVISPNEWRRMERMNPRDDGEGDSFRAASSGSAPVLPNMDAIKQKALAHGIPSR
jgi:HK97 family phage portal protein